MQKRRSLVLLAAAAAASAALLAAPIAAAEPGGEEPLLPQCETVGGNSVLGGQSSDCATPGNSEIVATPSDIGAEGAMEDEAGAFGFGW